MVTIFDRNSSNIWRMIFLNPKKIQNIIFHSKVIAIWNIYGFSRILGHLLIKCMGKHISNLQKDFNGFALPCCGYNGFLKIQITMSMLIRQFGVYITS